MADQRETATTETTAGTSERPGDTGRIERPLDPDQLTEGPELDRLVHIMVRELHPTEDGAYPPYSTDESCFNDIRRVVGFLAIQAAQDGFSASVTLPDSDQAERAWGETRALALCRAGVKAAIAAGR